MDLHISSSHLQRKLLSQRLTDNVFTFHPIRQDTNTGMAHAGDWFCIDYIEFCQAEDVVEPNPEPDTPTPDEPEPVIGNLEILLNGNIKYTKAENNTEVTVEYKYKPELPANVTNALNIKYIKTPIFGNVVVWTVGDNNYYNFGVTIPTNTQSKRVCAFSYICSNETLTSFYYSINFE